MGYYPQESLYKPYKYHGYTVRGTPNCPLIIFLPKHLQKLIYKNFPRHFVLCHGLGLDLEPRVDRADKRQLTLDLSESVEGHFTLKTQELLYLDVVDLGELLNNSVFWCWMIFDAFKLSAQLCFLDE